MTQEDIYLGLIWARIETTKRDDLRRERFSFLQLDIRTMAPTDRPITHMTPTCNAFL